MDKYRQEEISGYSRSVQERVPKGMHYKRIAPYRGQPTVASRHATVSASGTLPPSLFPHFFENNATVAYTLAYTMDLPVRYTEGST